MTGKSVEGRQQKGKLLRWAHDGKPASHGLDPGAFRIEAVHKTLRLVGKLFGPRRYFGLEVTGWERLPPSPVLLVGNHSGGTTVLDVWGLLAAWYRHFEARPLHVLAHELVLGTEATGRFFETRGVLAAQPAVAVRALSEFRRDVLVLPGGERDTWRPSRERYKVRFAGRTGYAKLAIRAGVPIVPVAHAGAHDTFYVFTDGAPLARALRIPMLARAEIWPVHLSLPWGLAVGPWPHLPLPVTLRYRFGEPILPGSREPSEDAVRALDERVREGLQRELDVLRAAGRASS